MTPDIDAPTQESIRAVDLALESEEPVEPDDRDLHDHALYIGRELSWMDFNDRVLDLCLDPGQRLLERVKMAAIWNSNLDEFFQIRVAGVHDQIDAGLSDPGPDGMTPSQTIDVIRERVRDQQERLERCVLGELLPALAEHGIRIVGMDDVGEGDRRALNERYRRQIFPVLTPLAVGPGREEEGVMHVAGGMAGRKVEGGEVVEVVLDVGALGQREAHFGEDGDHLVHDLHGRMHAPLAARRGGKGEIQASSGEARVEIGRFQHRPAFGERRGDAVPQSVDRRALLPTRLGRHRAQGLEQRRDCPGLAERPHAHRLERRDIRRGGDFGQEVGFEDGVIGHGCLL